MSVTTEERPVADAVKKAFPIPDLKDGEVYVGAIINADGSGHLVVLLPGDNDDAEWQKQKDWAASIGGTLPNRVEQALLFDQHKDQFKEEWYWSEVENTRYPSYAWFQNFGDGSQDDFRKVNELRARAVRRLPI